MHVQVDYALRNKVVIHMLSYNGNECEANIPQLGIEIFKFKFTQSECDYTKHHKIFKFEFHT